MKGLLIAVVFIVGGIELGSMAWDKGLESIQSDLDRIHASKQEQINAN